MLDRAIIISNVTGDRDPMTMASDQIIGKFDRIAPPHRHGID
jgi:hypothetical protein